MSISKENEYFQQLNQMLKNHQRAIPCLCIDLNGLDENIATLTSNFNQNAAFRIVVKSLPSFELIQYIAEKANTQNFMVFHQPFLTALASKLNEKADILLGKPMPVKTAHFFYDNLPQQANGFNPYQQIQWLVDTQLRIHQYIELAKKTGQKLRLNLELDIGLHRGGFGNINELKAALQIIKTHQDSVEFSGFMGYDPHVVKLPSLIRSKEKALRLANDFYNTCKTLVHENFPDLWNEKLTFNGAGSPTINLHKTKNSPLNDISAGSCLVMPTTFDIPTLRAYQQACYIATPVLKKFEGTTIPALERMKNILNLINSNHRKSFFIYGGFWKADYCYPEGTRQNTLFGASTNQTMLNAPKSAILEVDDFVFLRPHQSEFVFLQFGEILAVRNHKIEEIWIVLKNN